MNKQFSGTYGTITKERHKIYIVVVVVWGPQHQRCLGPNSGGPHARQVLYPLYYSPGPKIYNIYIFIVTGREEKK